MNTRSQATSHQPYRGAATQGEGAASPPPNPEQKAHLLGKTLSDFDGTVAVLGAGRFARALVACMQAGTLGRQGGRVTHIHWWARDPNRLASAVASASASGIAAVRARIQSPVHAPAMFGSGAAGRPGGGGAGGSFDRGAQAPLGGIGGPRGSAEFPEFADEYSVSTPSSVPAPVPALVAPSGAAASPLPPAAGSLAAGAAARPAQPCTGSAGVFAMVAGQGSCAARAAGGPQPIRYPAPQHCLPNLVAAKSAAEAVGAAGVVVLAVPTSAIPQVLSAAAPALQGDHQIILGSRGFVVPGRVDARDLTGDTPMLPHELVRRLCCVRQVGVLGGPLAAPDVAAGASPQRPVTGVLASAFDAVLTTGSTIMTGAPVFVHTSHDVVGLALCGAMAHVAALVGGLCDGLNLGSTAQGALVTRVLAEAERLGRHMGADRRTFSGLGGVGELLIPRFTGANQRNQQLGRALAKGQPLSAALLAIDGEPEALSSAQGFALRAAALGIQLPLMQAVAHLCSGDVMPGQAQVEAARTALDELLRQDIHLAG